MKSGAGYSSILANMIRINMIFQGDRKELARLDREVIAQRCFSYVRVGFDQRTMEFLPDHRIGRGADIHERRWWWCRHNGKPCLCIGGDRTATCRLHLSEDGLWRGAWLAYEKMNVFLRPVSAGVPTPRVATHPLFREARARNPVYEVVQYYRRTVGCHPGDKRLVAVRSQVDAPMPFGRGVGELSDEVLFATLRCPATGLEFWAKRYSTEFAKQLDLELDLCLELSGRDARTVLPIDYTEENGLIFEFNPELFRGTAIHVFDVWRHFSGPELAEIHAFAEMVIPHPRLGEMRVTDFSDFQTVATSRGVRFIDFCIKPEHWWKL